MFWFNTIIHKKMLIKLTCDLGIKSAFFRSRPTMAELSLILWVFQLILDWRPFE
jgi:hypothetical protein